MTHDDFDGFMGSGRIPDGPDPMGRVVANGFRELGVGRSFDDGVVAQVFDFVGDLLEKPNHAIILQTPPRSRFCFSECSQRPRCGTV
jgi:hypothetical protein